MPTEGPLRLGFLMFPGFPMACLTSAIEPLRAANEITGRREFEWRLVAETRAPVRSSAEVRFEPDVTLAEAEGMDQLYILAPPTATFADARHSPARLRWLDRADHRGLFRRHFPLGPRRPDGGTRLFGALVL